MKRKMIKLFLIVICQCISLVLVAQEELKEGKIKINNRIYTVSGIGTEPPPRGYWIKCNAEFIQKQRDEPGSWVELNYAFVGSETFSRAIVKVLGESRISELSADKGIIVTRLYPDHTGKIRAITFMKMSTQTITLKELARITDYIMSNLSYKVPTSVKPQQKIHPYTYVIRFKSLMP